MSESGLELRSYQDSAADNDYDDDDNTERGSNTCLLSSPNRQECGLSFLHGSLTTSEGKTTAGLVFSLDIPLCL